MAHPKPLARKSAKTPRKPLFANVIPPRPKGTPELAFPDRRVMEAGFPPANAAAFVVELNKLREAHKLETEHDQRVAIWLTLSAWQVQQAQQSRDALHQRMDGSRGLPEDERTAELAGCRRELVAWAEFEMRAQKQHVAALSAWQEVTGARPAQPRKPDPLADVRHLLSYTPPFPPVRNTADAHREQFIREALWIHFRTTPGNFASHGVVLPPVN